MRSGIFPLPLTEGEGRGRYQDSPISTTKGHVFMEMTVFDAYGRPTPCFKQEPAAGYLMDQVADVFATYRVDPHDEGAPVQEVLDHLVRCIGALVGAEDREWFESRSMLGEPVFRFDHEVQGA